LCLLAIALFVVQGLLWVPKVGGGGIVDLTIATDAHGKRQITAVPLNVYAPRLVPQGHAILEFDVYDTGVRSRWLATVGYLVYAPGESTESLLADLGPQIEDYLRGEIPGTVACRPMPSLIQPGAKRALPITGQRLVAGYAPMGVVSDLILGGSILVGAAGLWRGRRRIWAGLKYSTTAGRVARRCCPQCEYAVDPSWQRRCPECGHELYGYDWPQLGDQSNSL
jgi:hypothetical protein